MNTLVTICARGGSKGVMGKNIRSLLGRPLISYTIEQALRWGKGADVVVTTDSERIAEIAKEHGASVPFIRPAELAGDASPKLPVIRHALLECERINGKKYDVVVDMDPTSPLRKVEDIEGCYQTFLQKRPDTLFSVVKAHKNPYFNMVEMDAEGYARLSKRTPSAASRRQDAPKVYDLNASIYVYGRDYLVDQNNMSPISDRSMAYIMDDVSGFDIDREVDFRFVEFILKEGIFTP